MLLEGFRDCGFHERGAQECYFNRHSRLAGEENTGRELLRRLWDIGPEGISTAETEGQWRRAHLSACSVLGGSTDIGENACTVVTADPCSRAPGVSRDHIQCRPAVEG